MGNNSCKVRYVDVFGNLFDINVIRRQHFLPDSLYQRGNLVPVRFFGENRLEELICFYDFVMDRKLNEVKQPPKLEWGNLHLLVSGGDNLEVDFHQTLIPRGQFIEVVDNNVLYLLLVDDALPPEYAIHDLQALPHNPIIDAQHA